MKNFSNSPRFELLADGTIYSRSGVQTNCGGIAGVHVRITLNLTGEITFQALEHEGEHDQGYGVAVPGAAVPALFRQAVFKGAKEAYEQSNADIGICFELLDALVHEIDARELRFQAAGFVAIKGWLNYYTKGSIKLA